MRVGARQTNCVFSRGDFTEVALIFVCSSVYILLLDFTTRTIFCGARGSLVIKALRYKPAGRGFDSRWCHWNFSLT